MTALHRFALAALTTALLAVGGAQAQEEALTRQEVEAYFDQVRQEATEMARAGELDRMVEWIDRNVADGAEFQVSMAIVRGGERKGFAALTLDKQDMRQMGGLMAGIFGQQQIEDYSLEIEVGEVTAHGPDAATVRTSWTESFTVRVPQGEGAERPDGESLSAEGVADCVQVIERDGDGLAMGLMTCTGEMRL